LEKGTTVSIALASAALTAALVAIFLFGRAPAPSPEAGRGIFVATSPPLRSIDGRDCFNRCIMNFCRGAKDLADCVLKCEDTCDFHEPGAPDLPGVQ
jgi:hypothetical protein